MINQINRHHHEIHPTKVPDHNCNNNSGTHEDMEMTLRADQIDDDQFR